MVLTNKDAPQAIRGAYDDEANAIRIAGSLVPENFDTLELTYVVAGAGAGEIETVTYIKDLSIVATLTLSYDGSNRLIRVERS